MTSYKHFQNVNSPVHTECKQNAHQMHCHTAKMSNAVFHITQDDGTIMHVCARQEMHSIRMFTDFAKPMGCSFNPFVDPEFDDSDFIDPAYDAQPDPEYEAQPDDDWDETSDDDDDEWDEDDGDEYENEDDDEDNWAPEDALNKEIGSLPGEDVSGDQSDDPNPNLLVLGLHFPAKWGDKAYLQSLHFAAVCDASEVEQFVQALKKKEAAYHE